MKLKRLESKSKVFCLHNTTEHTKQHLEAWVHLSARPMKYFIKLTHVKNSPIKVIILRTHHSQTRKPKTTKYWKKRNSTYAMASPLGL